jgi:hypothetical protein
VIQAAMPYYQEERIRVKQNRFSFRQMLFWEFEVSWEKHIRQVLRPQTLREVFEFT